MDFLAKVIVLIAAIITLISKLPELKGLFSKTKRMAKKTRKTQSVKSKQSNEVSDLLIRARRAVRSSVLVIVLLAVCLLDLLLSPKPLGRFDVFAIALDIGLIFMLVEKIESLGRSIGRVESRISVSN